MSKTTSQVGRVLARSPISIANTIMVVTFLTGSGVLALLGNLGMALFLAYLGLAGLGLALYARRPNARDITRINSIEYRDERDRSLAAEGFAVVGVAALIIVLLAFIVMVFLDEFNMYVFVIFMALLIVWGVANSIVVRRR